MQKPSQTYKKTQQNRNEYLVNGPSSAAELLRGNVRVCEGQNPSPRGKMGYSCVIWTGRNVSAFLRGRYEIFQVGIKRSGGHLRYGNPSPGRDCIGCVGAWHGGQGRGLRRQLDGTPNPSVLLSPRQAHGDPLPPFPFLDRNGVLSFTTSHSRDFL